MAFFLPLAIALLGSVSAMAAPTVINLDVVQGRAAFDAAVRAQGGVVQLQPLDNLDEAASSWTFDALTVRVTNGRRRFIDDDYAQLRAQGDPAALSGQAIGLSPEHPVADWGLTFDFDAPVNAFGLEVGDWGTCCWASSLWIAFDGGATREVATAWSVADNPGFAASGRFTSFVGAFDTGGRFGRVSFWGDGLGEYLVAGGTLRFAALPPAGAAVVQGAPVSEPPVGALAAVSLLVLGLHRRRR